jgi:Tfp pilus assembly protein FimT
MRISLTGSKSRGFTYVELSVIIVVLALLAALVMPRLATVRDSVDAKLNLDAVQRMASRARELAIQGSRPVTMAYSESDAQFELRQTDENGDSAVVSSVPLHPAFEVSRLRTGVNELTGSDWTLTFYADGTSDGGAVELSEGGITRTLVIGAKSGLSAWQAGAMPASEADRWPAGEYERRA